MGFTFKSIAVAIAVGALAVTVMAQGPGGGGPGGGGGGGRQRGFGGPGMMMGRGGPFSMLDVKEIQDELKLTSDQVTKIEALRTEYQDASRKARQDARDSGMSREDQQKAGQKMTDEYTKKLNDIINADQQKRLKELRIQRAGNMALMMPDVQKELAFTTKQTDDVKAQQQKMMDANQELFTKVRNNEMTMEDAQKSMQKNNETFGAELLKILTPDQTTKFKAMSGKPFTFPKSMDQQPFGGRNRPGGGGPGGGGGTTRGGGG